MGFVEVWISNCNAWQLEHMVTPTWKTFYMHQQWCLISFLNSWHTIGWQKEIILFQNMSHTFQTVSQNWPQLLGLPRSFLGLFTVHLRGLLSEDRNRWAWPCFRAAGLIHDCIVILLLRNRSCAHGIIFQSESPEIPRT